MKSGDMWPLLPPPPENAPQARLPEINVLHTMCVGLYVASFKGVLKSNESINLMFFLILSKNVLSTTFKPKTKYISLTVFKKSYRGTCTLD